MSSDPTTVNAVEVPDTDSEVEGPKEAASIAASEESKPEGQKEEHRQLTNSISPPKMENEEQQIIANSIWAAVNKHVECKKQR